MRKNGKRDSLWVSIQKKKLKKLMSDMSNIDSGSCQTLLDQVKRHGLQARGIDLGKKIDKSNKMVDSLVNSYFVVTTIAFTTFVFCMLKKKFRLILYNLPTAMSFIRCLSDFSLFIVKRRQRSFAVSALASVTEFTHSRIFRLSILMPNLSQFKLHFITDLLVSRIPIKSSY